MREQYEKFDGELLKNEFLKRHYECLPFIGERYENSRLLLIGESHYIPKDAVHCVNRCVFYDDSFDDLEEGYYKGWINTRSVFESRVYEGASFKVFFSNPATEIAKIVCCTNTPSIDQKINAMHEYAFVNYFKRPSYDKGKTINELTEKDYRYAYEVSKYIIAVLQPRLIVFLSKKAYNAFCEASNQSDEYPSKIECVSHPSSCWWNRKRKDGKCAKEEFYDYISQVL